MTEQAPSIGRIVHYVSYGTPGGEYSAECRAAVISEVHTGDTVGVVVLNPTGMFFNRSVPHDPGVQDNNPGPEQLCDSRSHRGGTWHWPGRV